VATVAGLFRNQNDVDCALRELNHNGYGKNSISIAAPDNNRMRPNTEGDNFVTQTDIDQAGAGILITVVTEQGHHTEVKELLQRCRAVDVDTRYGFGDRGGIDEYEDITDESRENRSTND
jgi:hypothetical protein